MGLIDRFVKTLIRRTPVERHNVERQRRRHAEAGARHMHSNLGTKSVRRKRRKIAHESRRVNFQGRGR